MKKNTCIAVKEWFEKKFLIINRFAGSPHFHLMLLFFQSSGLCVQSPSIIPVPGYPLCLVFPIIKRLAITLMYCNRLHAW